MSACEIGTIQLKSLLKFQITLSYVYFQEYKAEIKDCFEIQFFYVYE